MTINQQQINYAAERLLASPGLVEKDMYLPKIYIVAGKCYWFLNAARRAAFGTNHRIYVLTIEDAFKIAGRKVRPYRHYIVKDFDQTGDTYHGKLYNQAGSIFANLVPNEIITIKL